MEFVRHVLMLISRIGSFLLRERNSYRHRLKDELYIVINWKGANYKCREESLIKSVLCVLLPYVCVYHSFTNPDINCWH